MRVKPGTIEEKVQQLQALEQRATPAQLADYNYRLNLSWIHHDSAIEGAVYEPSELVAALGAGASNDTALAPIYDEIRNYKAAIDLIRQLAVATTPIDLDTIKDLYATLVPEDADAKGPPRYRKDMPLHRVYFHELATPDKISPRMRQLVTWLTAEDTLRQSHPTRIAAKAHHELLQIFPFPKHSGKVARLLMNLILMRAGYPPAILHATDRQRYYDALKGSGNTVSRVINDALGNAVNSGLRYWSREFGLELGDL